MYVNVDRSMGIAEMTLILLTGYQIQCTEYISAPYFNAYTWLNFDMSKVATSLSPLHQVMVFTSNQHKLAPQNEFIRLISLEKPVIITDFAKIKEISGFFLRRSVSIYVILFYAKYDGELESILKVLTSREQYSTRPKCLVIYFHSDKGEETFRTVGEQAWKEKFLDFTIIDVNLNLPLSVPMIGYYNPFESRYYNIDLNKTEAIFPDKLIDTYHYEFILKSKSAKALLQQWPNVEFSRRWLLIAALNKFNFKLKSDQSKESQANMNFIRRITSPVYNRPKVQIFDGCEKVIAVVPVIPISRLGNYYLPISYFCIMAVFLVATALLRSLSGVNDSFWNSFNVVKMLIGVPIDVLPRARVQAISFIFFAFISMKYSSDFYNEIVGIRLIHDTVAFDTFADINNSQLPIYINEQLSQIVGRHVKDDSYVKTLKAKFIFERNMANCIRKLRNEQQVICVLVEIHAMKQIDVRVMTIAKPVFACLHWDYRLEDGSPYIDRLQMLINRLLEAGMHQSLKRNKKLSKGAAMFSSEIDDFFILIIFGFVLSVGYGASIIAFLCEWGYAQWKWKRATTQVRRFFVY